MKRSMDFVRKVGVGKRYLQSCRLIFMRSTLITTIFDFMPHFFPFFSPNEWPFAYNANFGREIRFFYVLQNTYYLDRDGEQWKWEDVLYKPVKSMIFIL